MLNRPVIVAINMLDVASNQGIQIDTKALQDSLGIPVIPMVAKRNSGIKELVAQISSLALCDNKFHPQLPEVSSDHQQIYQKILEASPALYSGTLHARMDCDKIDGRRSGSINNGGRKDAEIRVG